MKRSSKKDKIDWLMERWELWESLPASMVIFTPQDLREYKMILDNMELDGLISRSGKYNVNLLGLIKEAREALYDND
jgi:hypothetical protein